MIFVNNICYLTVGDKIKNNASNEGGVVLKVIDKDYAEIEFFDETLVVHTVKINPFSVLSHQTYHEVQFYKEEKLKKKSKPTKAKKSLPSEIDLHAEVLFPGQHRHMSNENIIQKKISHLIQYLEQVTKSSNHNSITIIHGKGTGSLRSQVIDVLENKFQLFNLDISDIGKTIVRL